MESGKFLGEAEKTKPLEVCWCKDAKPMMEELKSSIIGEFKSSIREFKSSLLEEIQNVYFASSPNASSSPHQSDSSPSKRLKLQFKDVPDSLLTMTKLEDEGTSVKVELLDDSGNTVEDGTDSCLKIKIDVLNGDFDVEDKVDWTEEDYAKNIAKPREGKGSLLKGKCKMELHRGVVGVGHLCFTDNSKQMRNGTFRLGATAENCPLVKPAISEAFRVKERRLKCDMKHKVPSPEDELFRLVHIRKNGPVHTKALEAGIRTVKDFLLRLETDAKELQNILGVPEANWKKIVINAKACKLPHMTDESCRNNNAARNYVNSSDLQGQEQPKQPLDELWNGSNAGFDVLFPAQSPAPSRWGFDVLNELWNGSNAGSLMCNQGCSAQPTTINATTATGVGNDIGHAYENSIPQFTDYRTDLTAFNYADLQFCTSETANPGGINFALENWCYSPAFPAEDIAVISANHMAKASCGSNKLKTKNSSRLFLFVKRLILAKRVISLSRRTGETDCRPRKKQKI